jgi:16S rRNA (adenine1518-N6/adenine1519-N6)-dimethyltransferase
MMRHRPTRALGQNFLKSKTIGTRIVGALGITAGDTVIEIGPGRGSLTDIILEQFPAGEIRFIAVEKDRGLIEELRSKCKSPWFSVIHDDIIRCDLARLVEGPKKKIKVLGNIPYNITSDIIFKLIEHRALLDSAVLTVQKEVADRIVAGPGSKTYGRLSVMVQFYAAVESLFLIKPTAFYPPPKVRSKVIRLEFNKDVCFTLERDEQLFGTIVRQAFSSRRKQLLNNLKELFDKGEVLSNINDLLKQRHLKSTVRAEELSVNDFIALTEGILASGYKLQA